MAITTGVCLDILEGGIEQAYLSNHTDALIGFYVEIPEELFQEGLVFASRGGNGEHAWDCPWQMSDINTGFEFILTTLQENSNLHG
jgi:hypothetical protein